MINQALLERFRCPAELAEFTVKEGVSHSPGYFGFGACSIGYGKTSSGSAQEVTSDGLPDATSAVSFEHGQVSLPFDPLEVIDNLRLEKYAKGQSVNGSMPLKRKLIRNAYYAFRPLFPVEFRRHLQRLYLRGWEDKAFPKWPVDISADMFLEQCLAYAMQASGLKEVPFVWFWPDGASASALMTHDVETALGLDFCKTLMDVNDEYGIPASFQVVPEKRYTVPDEYLQNMRDRGFEVGVQDLNHDGHLYSHRDEFLRRAKLINAYAKHHRATGFRAAILYRNLEWLKDLDISYDMSVPNVAHLDPQRGGCCTVFPYFIDSILEIPVTTTQDYSLFHILQQYSIDLWKVQTKKILERNGMMSFIVHPDYITTAKPLQTYRDLLAHLRDLREHENVWVTLPGEIDRWWRARSKMKIVSNSGKVGISGPESHRARIAYARLEGNQVSYHL